MHRLITQLSLRTARQSIALVLWLATATAGAATWFVAPNGLDASNGSSNAPFLTLMRAQSAASAGDTVFLRGGNYFLNNTHVTATNAPWAIVNRINKNGINYLGFPGERPVFDFSSVKPPGWRVTAFLVTASDCVFKGFDVVGAQVTIRAGEAGNTQSECFRVAGGNRNRFEHLAMRDGMGVGWYLTSGQSNLVLNCDAYNNRGLDSLSMGNVDGFGAHPSAASGSGNVFSGCRAWFNSDDGFDLIGARAAVTIDRCWAFYNGYFTNFTSSGGDGHGFKAGGYGRNGSAIPSPVPRHVTQFCLAVRNRVSGFYANHHTGGLNWFHNTAFRNSVNYNMLSTLADNETDVPGYGHLMKNNLGFRASTEVANLGSSNDVSFNYFTLPVTIASNDFASFDESLLTQPRQANGVLPNTAFANLLGSSDLVNAGTNIGFVFAGVAPDLGAFERGLAMPPFLRISRQDSHVLLSGQGGWGGGPYHLIASTNLRNSAAEWALIHTNRFDAAGTFLRTNAATPPDNRFFRVRLP